MYLWGENSPISNLIDIDLFDSLQNDIEHFKSKGTVLVSGDFNARTSRKHDFILHDQYISDIDPEDYGIDTPLPRFSMDKGTNSYGNRLIDLCKATSLRIANGRLGDDFGKGLYTCYNTKGASLIDYMLLSEKDFVKIKKFCVDNFNEFSDHAALNFELLCNSYNESVSESFNFEYVKWSDDEKELYRSGLIAKLSILNNILLQCNLTNVNSVNTMVNSFTDVIREVSDPLFLKRSNKYPKFESTAFIKSYQRVTLNSPTHFIFKTIIPCTKRRIRDA